MLFISKNKKNMSESNVNKTDLKIIIKGKSGAGKTSYVNKWTKNEFLECYKPTIVSEQSY